MLVRARHQAPRDFFRTVKPQRLPNSAPRAREYLTPAEVKRLAGTARNGRYGHRRGGPFTPDAVNRLVKRIRACARLAFAVHAHMLRHAFGYPWPTPATTRGGYRIGSAIDRSRTRRATRN